MNISTVGNTAMSSAAADASSSTSTTTTADATDGLANEQTFLKLFVAQLQNQDPLNPEDGTQFVAQLAQFSQLEQSLQMRKDLDAINQELNTLTANPGATTPTGTAS
jgi:flagellar basal-body rod modification protein FlgD